jgi:hypothetical protein
MLINYEIMIPRLVIPDLTANVLSYSRIVELDFPLPVYCTMIECINAFELPDGLH